RAWEIIEYCQKDWRYSHENRSAMTERPIISQALRGGRICALTPTRSARATGVAQAPPVATFVRPSGAPKFGSLILHLCLSAFICGSLLPLPAFAADPAANKGPVADRET